MFFKKITLAFLPFFLIKAFLFAEFAPFVPFTDLERDLPVIAAGCVNVITGDYVEHHTDLYIPGPIPLTFERSYSSANYCSRSLFQGWRHNHDGWIEVENENDPYAYKGGRERFAHFIEPSGKAGIYKSEGGNYLFDSRKNKEVTNCASGRTHVKNNVIKEKGSYELEVKTSHGSKAKYSMWSISETLIKQIIREEKFLNKNKLLYNYTESRYNPLAKITTANEDGTPYAYCTVKTDLGKHPQCVISSSDGRKITYVLSEYKKRSFWDKAFGVDRSFHIKEVHRTDAPSITYDYVKKKELSDELVSSRILPDGRNLKIEYYNNSSKVRTLHAPINNSGNLFCVNYFIYSDKTKKDSLSRKVYSTKMKNFFGQLTNYQYDKNKRLCEVKKYFSSYRHDTQKEITYAESSHHYEYSSEKFIWDDQGNLRCRRFDDAWNRAKLAKYYQYDSKGNVTTEKLYGNLTGIGGLRTYNDSGFPADSLSEHYDKFYKYGYKNLVTEEREGNGKCISYEYYPKTDLVKLKLTKVGDTILEREHYRYEKGVVVFKAVDNGSSPDWNNSRGVTERLITRIKLTQSKPIGLPEIVEEKCFDFTTNQEILLSKEVIRYSPQGRILQKDIYDANNIFSHSLFWEYDAHGNVTKEINALGHVTTRKYDANDNLIQESGPNPSFYKEYAYDFNNRLTREDLIENGKRYSTHYEYDALGQNTAITDINGIRTEYRYDDMGRETFTSLPAVPTTKGNLVQVGIVKDYDIFGNIIRLQDQRCDATTTTYNAYNNPIIIDYPDGTQEQFRYNLDGTLKATLTKNGSLIVYQHDIFGRVTEEKEHALNDIPKPDRLNTFFSKDFDCKKARVLSCNKYTYNAFHLLESIDPENIATKYTYDGAGRLITVTKGEAKTTYQYDALGRLHKTCEWFSTDDYLVKVNEYDLLDRVIEERTEDSLGNTLEKKEFGYDLDGNLNYEACFTESGKSETITTFNAFQQPTLITDALGNSKSIEYCYGAKNKYGQSILQTIETDPLGTQIITYMNAWNKPGEIIKKDPHQTIISQKEMYYDGIGNVQNMKEIVYTPEEPERELWTNWHYNSMSQLDFIQEAANSTDKKTTLFHYNNRGQLKAIVKPDETEILHEYDAKGRLKHYFASDNSFDYTYTYNKNDLPIKVIDNNNGTETLRSYDSQGNMTQETLGNDITLKYYFDRISRPIKIIFPDDSSIHYIYDAAHLKEIKRLSPSGEICYSHQYLSYDLCGTITHSKLAGEAGEQFFKRDLLNRIQESLHDKWSQKNIQYDSLGNLLTFSLEDFQGLTDCDFSYDYHNQITSESGVKEHTFQNDSVFNRVKKDDTSYKLNNLNQILSEGDNRYEYDPNGNLIQMNDNTYTYDALNRLTSATVSGETYVYYYDAFNRRLSKKTSTTDEHYIYQGQNEVGMMEDGKIQQLRILGNGPGAEIGASVALEIEDQVYVPIHNHNGSIASLFDLQGNLVETIRYSAFGETDKKPQVPWTFLSKRFDEETEFIYFGRRYYYPRVGRWINPDPAGYIDGPNLYAYVRNNPLIGIDEYGLFTEEHNAYREFTSDPFQGDDPLLYSGIYTGEFDRSLVEGIGSGAFQFGKGAYQFVAGLFGYGDDSPKQETEEIQPAEISDNFFDPEICKARFRSIGENVGYFSAEALALGGLGKAYQGCKSVYKGFRYTGGATLGAKSIQEGEKVLASAKKTVSKAIKPRVVKVKPHPNAVGPHTSFKIDPVRKRVSKYVSYETNPVTNRFVPFKRFRGTGGPHDMVHPPFILEKPPGGGIGSSLLNTRKPHRWELPRGYK